MRIVIDGNIGAGKTTQLNILELAGYNVKREPIDDWPLELFYQDKKRWAFLMHVSVLTSLSPECNTIHERCVFTTAHVFWKLMKNKVNPEEDKLFMKLYEKYKWVPDLYIYIHVEPEVAWEHIQNRDQAGDSGITLEYLKEIDQCYKEMLKILPCKVVIIQGNKSKDVIHSEILEYITIVGNADQKDTKHMCHMS
jgi:deoxyadenosine/deoxycytidine kinase